jgi:hypothetical protein
MTGKDRALLRLSDALVTCTQSGRHDQEEIDHLEEIVRLIREDVPARYFEPLDHFTPSPMLTPHEQEK